MADIGLALAHARALGYSPGIHRQGAVWRIHLEVATGAYEDCGTLATAGDWLEAELERRGPHNEGDA